MTIRSVDRLETYQKLAEPIRSPIWIDKDLHVPKLWHRLILSIFGSFACVRKYFNIDYDYTREVLENKRILFERSGDARLVKIFNAAIRNLEKAAGQNYHINGIDEPAEQASYDLTEKGAFIQMLLGAKQQKKPDNTVEVVPLLPLSEFLDSFGDSSHMRKEVHPIELDSRGRDIGRPYSMEFAEPFYRDTIRPTHIFVRTEPGEPSALPSGDGESGVVDALLMIRQALADVGRENLLFIVTAAMSQASLGHVMRIPSHLQKLVTTGDEQGRDTPYVIMTKKREWILNVYGPNAISIDMYCAGTLNAEEEERGDFFVSATFDISEGTIRTQCNVNVRK